MFLLTIYKNRLYGTGPDSGFTVGWRTKKVIECSPEFVYDEVAL